jgi:hypothetical protein
MRVPVSGLAAARWLAAIAGTSAGPAADMGMLARRVAEAGVLASGGVGVPDAGAHRAVQAISACMCSTRRLPGEPAGPHGQRRCRR